LSNLTLQSPSRIEHGMFESHVRGFLLTGQLKNAGLWMGTS